MCVKRLLAGVCVGRWRYRIRKAVGQGSRKGVLISSAADIHELTVVVLRSSPRNGGSGFSLQDDLHRHRDSSASTIPPLLTLQGCQFVLVSGVAGVLSFDELIHLQPLGALHVRMGQRGQGRDALLLVLCHPGLELLLRHLQLFFRDLLPCLGPPGVFGLGQDVPFVPGEGINRSIEAEVVIAIAVRIVEWRILFMAATVQWWASAGIEVQAVKVLC